MRNITDSTGGINSVYPCTEYLTFGPWIYMVPQFKTEDVLMLGYAGGTTAGLIRLIYGGIPITAVDIEDSEDYYNVIFVKADARDYIKSCRFFDTVIVDLYDDGAYVPSSFIFEKEFVEDLKKIGRYIIVHAHKDSDMSNYDMKLVKMLSLNDDRFYYYRTREIHTLPIQ